MISRLDGSRSPGRSRATSARSIAATWAILLSFFMKTENSAITQPGIAIARGGTFLAFLGVLAFSGSFPATVLALEGFDPWLVAFGRAAIAGTVALACLAAAGLPLLPPRP